MKHFLSNKINISNLVNGESVVYITIGKMYEVKDAYNISDDEIDLSNGTFILINGTLQFKHFNGEKETVSHLKLYTNLKDKLRIISPYYIDQIDVSYYRKQRLKELLNET